MLSWLSAVRDRVVSFFGGYAAKRQDPPEDDGNSQHPRKPGRAQLDSRIFLNLQWVFGFFYWAIAFGLIAVIVHGWGALAVALLWALSSLAVGIAVGFIFGIPKILQVDKPTTPEGEAADPRYQQMVNTNLVEISDWLTKIIVGLSLVQMGNIPGYVESMAREFAAGMGNHSDKAFAEGILVYFSVVGFLYGYLLTRLFLAGAFALADQEAAEKLEKLSKDVEGEAASAHTKADFASALLAENARVATGRAAVQEDPMAHLRALVEEYNKIRREQRAGSARTTSMTGVVTRIIALSPLLRDFKPAEAMQNKEDGGWRLAAFAYLYAHPDSALLKPLVNCLTTSEDTPFGQYWAVQAIGKILETMNRDSVESEIIARLRQFLQTRLKRGTDRYTDLARILGAFADGEP